MTIIGINIEFLNWYQILQSSPFQLVFFIGAYFILTKIYTAISLFYLICYYFQLKSQNLNKRILLLSHLKYSSFTSLMVTKLILDHNMICSKISSYNKFWQKTYFYFVFTLIPANLCSLHQLLFEDMKLYSVMIIILVIVYTWFFIFFLSYCTASLSKLIHKTSNKLLNLLLKRNQLNICTKLKLMICFERVNNDKKIGFSLKSLFVMTYPALCKVSPKVFIVNKIQ